MPSGTELIAAERQRQIEMEGWTAEHDQRPGHFRNQQHGKRSTNE
jgi:hypothetical protein